MPIITGAARTNIPGADLVSISIRQKDGTLATVAPTDDLATRLDELQYEFREGPCFEAVEAVHPRVSSPDVRHDARWPRFGPSAGELGVRAQMGIQIDHGGETVGLNLYSREVGAFEAPNDLAELFVLHASASMGHARDREDLSRALQTRADIGKAVGIVMARYDMTDDRAFEFLVRMSQDTNVKLRDLARRIVELRAEDFAVPEPAPRRR